MFDYIKVSDKVIPDERNSNDEYQTKSFDNFLEKYEINENGELFKISCKGELQEYEESVFQKYSGEINFHNENRRYKAWIKNGLLKDIIKI